LRVPAATMQFFELGAEGLQFFSFLAAATSPMGIG
jgi:hypothetical protein